MGRCNASIYNMGKLTVSIRLEVDTFDNIWKGWLKIILGNIEQILFRDLW